MKKIMISKKPYKTGCFSANFRCTEAEMLKKHCFVIGFSKIMKSQLTKNLIKPDVFCVKVTRVLRTRTAYAYSYAYASREKGIEEKNKWHAGLGSYRNGASSKLK